MAYKFRGDPALTSCRRLLALLAAVVLVDLAELGASACDVISALLVLEDEGRRALARLPILLSHEPQQDLIELLPGKRDVQGLGQLRQDALLVLGALLMQHREDVEVDLLRGRPIVRNVEAAHPALGAEPAQRHVVVVAHQAVPGAEVHRLHALLLLGPEEEALVHLGEVQVRVGEHVEAVALLLDLVQPLAAGPARRQRVVQQQRLRHGLRAPEGGDLHDGDAQHVPKGHGGVRAARRADGGALRADGARRQRDLAVDAAEVVRLAVDLHVQHRQHHPLRLPVEEALGAMLLDPAGVLLQFLRQLVHGVMLG
mmetsp:Transcript_102017/g.263725  ORF Transcript_102017/g.263725 Transcript_102017/m.263725 type:complete len:313 (-) Transcript_102017:113-1051(-)